MPWDVSSPPLIVAHKTKRRVWHHPIPGHGGKEGGGGDPTIGERSRSVPPSFGIIPPNRSVFPVRDAGGGRDDVSQEQLAPQQFFGFL